MSAQSADAGAKIKDALDDAFAVILQDGVGQFDTMFHNLNFKFDSMQSEIVELRGQVDTLTRERNEEVAARHKDIGELTQIVTEQVEAVEWRVKGEIDAYKQGLTDAETQAAEAKAQAVGRKVIHRLKMKWVYMTFNNWAGLVEEKKEEERMIKQAANKFFRSAYQNCFVMWRNNTVGEKKARAEMSTKANYERIEKIEEAMGLEVEQRHHEIAQVNVVLKQLEVLIDSQNQEAAKRRHAEIEAKLRRTMMVLTMGALTTCFDGWKSFYTERKETKTLLTKIGNMMLKRGLTLCFGGWKKVWEVESGKRLKGAEEATSQTNFDKIAALEKTVEENKAHFDKLVVQKAEDNEVMFNMKLDTKLQALEAGLTDAAAKAKKDLAIKHAKRTVMKMLNRALVGTFEEWKSQWEEKRDLERKLKRAVALFANAPLVKCFRLWQQEWSSGRRKTNIASVEANFRRLGELEEKEKDVQGALQAETEQRHYEAEQVKNVLQHLERMLGSSFDALNGKQEAHMEALKNSGMRAIMFRMKNNALGSAYQDWRLGMEAEKREKAQLARNKNVVRTHAVPPRMIPRRLLEKSDNMMKKSDKSDGKVTK